MIIMIHLDPATTSVESRSSLHRPYRAHSGPGRGPTFEFSNLDLVDRPVSVLPHSLSTPQLTPGGVGGCLRVCSIRELSKEYRVHPFRRRLYGNFYYGLERGRRKKNLCVRIKSIKRGTFQERTFKWVN